jgi:phosphate/sulfate permease
MLTSGHPFLMIVSLIPIHPATLVGNQNVNWTSNPMAWLGILQGAIIWAFMALFLGLEVAWISFACGGLIGFFLFLVGLGYEDKTFTNASVAGIALNCVLSVFSAFLAFN